MGKNFFELFGSPKPIIGMIHLAGGSTQGKINRALGEISIFEEEGINGAIVENYHGSVEDVINTFKVISKRKTKLVIGINLLGKPYLGVELANRFGAKFVQFDSVQTQDLDLERYNEMRKKYSDITVLGGIRFKYTSPTRNSLEQDLSEGMSRCEAIVTTGEGTGIETPIEKLLDFREIMGNYFPLISGEGVNKDNVCEQLSVADGIIVGRFLKNYNTRQKINRNPVKELMRKVKKLNIY